MQNLLTFIKSRPRRLVITIAAAAGLITVLALLPVMRQHRQSEASAETAANVPLTVPVERGDVKQSVSAPGQVVDAGGMIMQSSVNAMVEENFVSPGDEVQQGQLLLRLGERLDFENLVSEANIKVLEAQAELDELDPQTLLSSTLLEVVKAEQEMEDASNERKLLDCQRATEETLELARSDVAIAKNELRAAEEQFDAVADTTQDDLNRKAALERLQDAKTELERANANLTWYLGTATGEEIAEMDARVEVAASKVQQARSRYEQAKENRHPDMLLAQAKLDNALKALEAAQADLDSLEVMAPFDGIVASLEIQAGQTVGAGAELLQLVNPASFEYQVTVTEEDIPYLSVGQQAEIYLDAMPDEDLYGSVVHILPKRASDERPLFTIMIRPHSIPERLFPGMTVDTSLIIESRSDVLRLPRSLVRARSDGSADIEVWQNGARHKRTIMTGLRGDTYVEILSGLEEGEEVVSE